MNRNLQTPSMSVVIPTPDRFETIRRTVACLRAQALLAAHRGPWAAVGPVVRNANPSTSVSWADFLIGYGPWCDPAPAGDLDHLPGHNSSYKRAILLDYGSELEGLLEAESVLH